MSTRDNVLKNDALIQELAIYEVTQGTTKRLTQEDLPDVDARFTEFKRLIKRGSFTYDQLADRIFSKYGIAAPLTPQPIWQDAKKSFESDQENIKQFEKIVGKAMKKEKSYPFWARMRDKFLVFCSRFQINI
jgi:hypothetical protein